MTLPFRKRPGVAVVEIHGVIGNQVKTTVYERLFDDIAQSKRYQALLLDIDSPGGSASGSQVLHHSLLKVAESKPIVAYVRGIGASGAYYLCSASSRVVALPNAMVGSIGVIYLRPILEQLLGKVGVEFSVFKEGRLKDMTGFWRSPTPEEEGKFQGLLTDIYDNFISAVVQGRSLEESAVRELATGEVFTATRGKELGLVDDFGGFSEALETAAQLGNARPRPLWVRPKRPFSARLFGRVGSHQPGISLLANQFQQLMSGGFYYLEPSYLMRDYPGEQE